MLSSTSFWCETPALPLERSLLVRQYVTVGCRRCRMLRDRYNSMDIFTLVPALRRQMEPVLTQLDHLLDDDTLFQLLKADLARRHPRTLTDGRPDRRGGSRRRRGRQRRRRPRGVGGTGWHGRRWYGRRRLVCRRWLVCRRRLACRRHGRHRRGRGRSRRSRQSRRRRARRNRRAARMRRHARTRGRRRRPNGSRSRRDGR